jgi:predicted RNA-binding Zn-ribbon protein involved in translation (DUF1610 family)
MQTVTKKIDFLISCFGEDHKLSRDGNNISFVCPKCGDEKKKKKLSICLESLMCHCWVCGLKGKTPYRIIKEYISHDIAVKFLKEFNVDNSKDKEEAKELLTFPTEFKLLGSMKNFYDPDDIDQNLTFYVSRSIDEDAFIKYQNCKADKTQMVFDEIRLDFNRELVIVEGVFDLVKCPDNSTCILGSSLRSEHLLFQKIVKNKTPVILALDSDMLDKSYSIANILSSYGISVKILDLGSYKDIGSMTEEIVRQKCLEAPTYSRHNRLRHLIGTINSGSIF